MINEAQQIVLRDGKQAIDDGDKGLQTYTPAKGNVNQRESMLGIARVTRC